MAKSKSWTNVKSTGYPVVDIDPNLIEVVEALRGRHFPPSEDAVKRLAISLIHEGQEQAVRVRKDAEGKPVAVFGVTRILAGRMIRNGFTGPDGGFRQDAEFVLRAEVADITAEQAFVQAIVENAHRNETTPVDDAFNQDRLRADGMSDAEIARLYGRDKAEISRLKKLLTLSEDHLRMVHEKRLSYSAAVELAFFKPEDRQNVLDATGGTLAGVKDARRAAETPQEAPEAPGAVDSINTVTERPAAKKATLQRTVKQIRNMVAQYCDHTTDHVVATLFTLVVAYIDGHKNEQEFRQIMDTIAPAIDRSVAEAAEAGWVRPADVVGVPDDVRPDYI